jgi:hypothetical protein
VQAATSGQTGALPVVTISQLDRLRVYVYLAQGDAAFVRVGDPATIRVPERLGKTYAAKVARVSGELDPRTRMMLTELDMDNRGGELIPGGFVEATLQIHTPRYVELPTEALVLRGDKTLVAVVTPQKTVHFQEVKVGYDDGQTVRLLSGLDAGQQVALNLGDAVAEGKNVRPIEGGASQQAGAAGGGKNGPPKKEGQKDGQKDGQKGGEAVGAKEQAGSSSGDSSGARQPPEPPESHQAPADPKK